MDKKNLSYGGGHSKVEFCDIINNDYDLVHVKRGTDSSSLSHLFAQGVVSAEAFRMDKRFRQRLCAALPQGTSTALYINPPTANRFTVVYAIVSEKSGPLQLPFFAKVTLKNAIRRLQSMGYNVAITKIDVSQSVKILSKYQPLPYKKAA